MRRLKSGWAVFLVITLGSVNAGQVRSVKGQLEVPWEQLTASGSDHQVEMTVWVYNRYSIPAELLQIALRQTATIFEHAGIRIGWLDCLPTELHGTTDHAGLPGPRSNTIVLTILGHANGRHRRSMGYAFQRHDGGKSAVMYYQRVGFMVEFVSNFSER